MVMLGYAGTSVVGKKIPDIVVVAAIAKDLLVIVGFMIIFFMSGQALVRPRLSGKTCTAVQLLTVLSVLLWPDLPRWLTYLPDTLWWLSLVLAVVAALDYVRVGGQFLNSQGTIRQA
jgi:phosphatidylglycerophosphate synthase